MFGPRCMIYGFVNPRTRELRYVGRSSTGMIEPRAHIYNARRGKRGCPHCYNMLRAIFARGLEPIIEVIEALPDDATDDLLNEREKWWIALGRAWGCRLTNLTDGGEGVSGYVFTSEQRARLGIAKRIVMARPDVKERHRAAVRAAHARPEVKANISAASRALHARPEVKKRHRAGICLALARPDVKKRMRASLIEAFARPDVKAKRSAAQLKTQARPEVKAAQRAGLIAALARPDVKARHRAGCIEAFARPEAKEHRRASIRASWVHRHAKEVLLTQQGPL